MIMASVSYIMENTNSVMFFKQKAAYEMLMSDWSSDVCSSDLECLDRQIRSDAHRFHGAEVLGLSFHHPAAVHLHADHDARGTDRAGGSGHGDLLYRGGGRSGGLVELSAVPDHAGEIGRASWRERGWQDV